MRVGPSTIITAILLALLLSACGSRYQAPVGEIPGGGRYIDSGRKHRVNSGETLYSIAWIYGVDYLDLARANDISPPYTIYTGQMLTVDLRDLPPRQRTPSASRQPTQQAAASKPAPRTDNQDRSSRSTASSASSRSSATTAAKPSPSASPARSRPAPPKPAASNGPIRWQWPAGGKVIKGFSGNDNDYKGIDISGSRGDPIRAAADGQVVYAGSGLLRYGDMIIIKHNDRFLSAYAHNDRLLVGEGETVKGGQRIAEMGSTGVDRLMLHFEIRLDGKPVDPMRYLPDR